MKLLETLRVLPATGQSRFGTLALGFDRVATVRDEHIALREVAAAACGVAPEDLNLDQVEAFLVTLSAARHQTPTQLTDTALEALASKDWPTALVAIMALSRKP